MLCRGCGRPLASPSLLLSSQVSPFDREQRNLTSLFGRDQIPLQTLKNPHGVQFQVVLFKKFGCVGHGKWVSEASWFPGFSWKICICPKCGQHLGWMFDALEDGDESEGNRSESLPEKPGDYGFYGIILDKLIDETCKCGIRNMSLYIIILVLKSFH